MPSQKRKGDSPNPAGIDPKSPRPQRDPARSGTPVASAKPKKRAKIVKAKGAPQRVPFVLYITLILMFLTGLTIAFTHAVIQDTRQQIATTRRQWQAVYTRNNETHFEIMPQWTHLELARFAEERLNMRPPLPHQVITIRLP